MPGSTLSLIEQIALVTLIAASAALFLYSSYWAFAVRRVLAGKIYRRQALWVAVVGLYFAFYYVAAAVAIGTLGSAAETNPLAVVGGDVFILVGFLVIFSWIDATMRVARRSDPMHRNTFHWSGLRYFIAFVTTAATLAAVIPWNLVAQRFFPALSSPPSASPTSSVFANAGVFGPIGTALFLGGIALLVAGRRSNDAILRRHLRWFGVFIVFLWVTSSMERDVLGHPFFTAYVTLVEVGSYALYAISALFLYESAKSLTQSSPYPEAEPPGAAAELPPPAS